MVDQLQGMFAKGEVIVYIWAEWIREFVMEPGGSLAFPFPPQRAIDQQGVK